MSRLVIAAVALLCASACTPVTTGAIDGIAKGSSGVPRPMATYGDALAPAAFYSFCAREKRLCNTRGATVPTVLTARRAEQLVRVNAAVNASVREVPDILSEGAEDVWTPATSVGDCEDIAILKKKRLLDLGWPASDLLLTVVRPRDSDTGHTLLTVRTDRGDLVLDNLTDRVKHWWDTPYRFYARQSVGRSDKWEFIGKDAAASAAGKKA